MDFYPLVWASLSQCWEKVTRGQERSQGVVPRYRYLKWAGMSLVHIPKHRRHHERRIISSL